MLDDHQNVNLNFINHEGECDKVTVYHYNIEVYKVEDTVNMLVLYSKLPCGFVRVPTPYLVMSVGPHRELHYALVDTG